MAIFFHPTVFFDQFFTVHIKENKLFFFYVTGKIYAINLLKTVLAHCVRELTFTSEANNLSFKIDLVLRPISGHLMQVKLRKDSQFDD